MISSTIFVAGVYGTGKSTMCSALSKMLHIPAFSAGDLISSINGEQYGANKAVADKDNNQILLVDCVRELHRNNGKIILAGHFCILNSKNDVEVLPESVYSALSIGQIILLEAEPETVISNLHRRDGKSYSKENVSRLIEKEREQSIQISKRLGCPLDIYTMTFSERDSKNVASLLR